jgi:hypothetical protein
VDVHVRDVAGEHEPPGCAPCDLDRKMWTLDLFQPAEEYERCIGANGGLYSYVLVGTPL